MRSLVCGLSDNANRLSHITVLFPLFRAARGGIVSHYTAAGEVREASEREGNRVYPSVLTPIVIVIRLSSSDVPCNSRGHNE